MPKDKLRILIISSADPTKGPGTLARDWYYAYHQQGHSVDVLTLNKCKSFPEFFYINDPQSKLYRLEKSVEDFKLKINRRVWAIIHRCNRHPKPGHIFFYRKEENPPVKVSKVLSKVRFEYDIVHIIFWQEMLSFKTVLALYRKLNCFFLFDCVDYSPMSGGCHFTGDCIRYKTGCGCCPAFQSKDSQDFTRHNVNYRRKVYEEVRPYVTGNSYMFGFYDQSYLLNGLSRIKSFPIIDFSLFKPVDRLLLHRKYGISENKKFKILFGCQNISDERKGIKYLIEALNLFLRQLSIEERAQVLIMSIGQDFDKVKPLLDEVDVLDFGFVPIEKLAPIYAFSDVFLCSSVNDAGPMMVNQSLCCGTPVVGFEMGVCIDAVKNQGTGYCAKLYDSVDFSTGITHIYKQTSAERMAMRTRCVELARRSYSYEAAVSRVQDAYNNQESKTQNT